ncbi:hypothetical protein Zmor_021807 [Zophobas morio]|uniref:CD109 antigen n=1 Tax=Zophobas morio TaxID=2755281 RepID=A0AA38I9T0_9CUCU|nr:hypothetical protein Zmor_021807 [Zophobas morio]
MKSIDLVYFNIIITGNQPVMRFKLRTWGWIFLIASSVTAQDININSNNQNDISSTISNYDVNNGPFTQEPTYSGDQYNRDGQYGHDNQNGPTLDRYEPTSGQYNPQSGQFDPNNGQHNPPPGQYDPQFGKADQFGGRTPNVPWKQDNSGFFGAGRNEIDPTIIREATYFIVASKTVRPGQLYRVVATILQEEEPLTVRASITRNGVEMTEDHKVVKQGIPETLLMRVPPTSVPGDYKLRVEGLYDDVLGVVYFVNETNLIFSQRSMTIFIQLDKPVYMQGEKVRFRAIPINTELKAFNEAVDVFMLDPNGHIMKRWLSRQSNLGTVSLDYQLSDQPVFGEWRVKVIAQNQVEESTFLVEEYYQTRFEVNVTMPAFFLNTEEYIRGVVMANYTSGAPVRGNLTLKAIVRPIKPIETNRIRNRNRNRNRNRDEERYYDNRMYNRNDDRRYGPQNYDELENRYDDYNNRDYNRPIAEKYFNFDEHMPFWFKISENYYEPIPSLKFFYGVYEFKYPIRELLNYVSTLDGMEVVIVATVGERFLDEVIEGYSTARIFNSSIKLSFLGGSPQVYKPGMPITTYVAASFHDGSSLPLERLTNGIMEVFAYVESPGGRRDLPSRQLLMLNGNPGVWEYKFDIKTELGLEGTRTFDAASQSGSIRIQARFRDGLGNLAETELLLLSHHSPNNQHIKVFTSTIVPQVGANMIFHIKSNFFIRKFNYMIISKGIVLVSSDQDMSDYIATMSVPLSAEMAPVATIVVWHLGRYGEVTVDSLTFPVNGISRNKFTVYINNKKARTGHKVEVAIYGEPGSYVGLSGIDRAFYTMQAGNELTYAKVISKMASFDENTNGTHQHTWSSHEGNPDDLVYFPSSTYGIDANRTFEYAGLVVFSDFELPRRWSRCNLTLGFAECLNGACYRVEKRCDYFKDCPDGTDEAGCKYDNGTELAMFRKYRFNRIQRQYENVWVWKDVNIGPHGRYIFNIPVPPRPVHWMVSAFSMSPKLGFGMINKAIEYIGVLPFFINVEMPNLCMQGEQVGIRVTVFNYMMDAMEATVVLLGSPDYKFVHVEENGVVRSYNPRTSFGEHQFFIYIKPQDAAVVYLPIVPTRLGDIDVTVYASTLIGKDQITRRIHVEADGLPQYRHQSMLLDLSNRAYAFQYMHVNVTEIPIIPYEYDRYYVYGSNKARISVVGDVVGPIFPTMPVNATSILHLPMESAEQNMFSFAANMYTTLYMRYTQQRNKTLEKLAFYYMNIGYQRQLSFMQPDGSFSLFRSDWWIHLNESPRSGLTVLDVTIPTGYIIQQQDLDAYILSRRVRNLQRAKYLERKVLFYFDYLDNEETCINFTVERWYPVANMSRYLPIRVYDYYAPERFNETIFDALSTYVLDICHVCGSSQCPYCWIYNTTSRVSAHMMIVLCTTFILIVKYFQLQDSII